MPLSLFSAPIMKFLGFNPEVAELSQRYLRISYFSEFTSIQSNNLKLFLRSQRIAWPSFAGSLLSFSVYLPVVKVLLYATSLKIEAIALANLIAQVF